MLRPFKKEVILSIIFPTKNSSKFLNKSIDILQNQTFKNFKILVVDGGSKDDTLKKFKKSSLNIEIISTVDKSFNEGVSRCLGYVKTPYLMIIGDDDEIVDESYIEKLINHIKITKSDITFPDYGEIIGEKYYHKEQPKKFDTIYSKVVVPGIGWIASKKIIGLADFDRSLIASSDYDFLLSLFKKGLKFSRCNGPIYYFRIGGNSYKNALTGFQERLKISLKHGGPRIKIYLNYYLVCVKFLIKYKILSLVIKKYKV
jgi:glycosyltransferase involved in cell wall biosynthesis